MKLHRRALGLLTTVIIASVSQSSARDLGLARLGRVTSTGSMEVARFDHAAALLPDGRVLVVGGISRNGEAQPSAELFDPASGRFSPAAAPLVRRGWGPASVPLADGRVLIVGGADTTCAGCLLDSAEIYDPATGRFTLTGRMNAKRAAARALLLTDGDVLIAGGEVNANPDSAEAASAPLSRAELYHPGSGRFSLTGQLHIPDPTQLVLLRDGQVLVVGESGAEIYDSDSGKFTPTGKMSRPRTKFGAALLPDGRVLIVGGQTGGPRGPREDTTEIYDPAAGHFLTGPKLNEKRFKLAHAVLPLKDGRVLVGGGAERPEVYDPQQRKFEMIPGEALDGFCFSTATLLGDGRVLLAGGYARPGGTGVNHAWLYRP